MFRAEGPFTLVVGLQRRIDVVPERQRDRRRRGGHPRQPDRLRHGDQHADDLVDRRARCERGRGVPWNEDWEASSAISAPRRTSAWVFDPPEASTLLSCIANTSLTYRSSPSAMHRSASSCLAIAVVPPSSLIRLGGTGGIVPTG